MPRIAHILIYPIKSLDPVSVSAARILPGGALEHDRRFALVDNEGAPLTAKRTPLVHQLRCRFDLEGRSMVVASADQEQAFHLDDDRSSLEAWCSSYFSLPLKLIENPDGGFPDDLVSPGPTIVSRASLEAVAGWFGLTLDETRRRFRPNLEIEDAEPFWEDRLFGEVGECVRFQIGEAMLMGVNPCQRCPVPTRDSFTGEAIPGFAKTFSTHRQQLLPDWAKRSHFDHYYRLSTNTRPRSGGLVRVGDEVRILDS